MDRNYSCPLVDSDIDATICYDIQMVTGAGNLINRRILEDYDDIFDIDKVTNERAANICSICQFNQLRIPVAQTGAKAV